MDVRARFAPAPTGHLHVGGARTALFNWLLAKGSSGTLILRIDDTDRQRSGEESYRGILDTLRWLGIDWDEGPEAGGAYGPYRQSERFDLYRKAAGDLESAGLAYRCYCTPEELAERKKLLPQGDRSGGYDRKCRDVDMSSAGEADHVLRFAVPVEGSVSITDVIRGEITFDLATIEDFVLLRSDGTPTFSLAGAYDDWAMGITHIVRGEDLLPVTPRQILLSRAFGRDVDPVFAHVPLIVAADRAPLSKRHGDVAVSWYREAGFVPEALVNYLALLGWGPEGEDEMITIDEMVRQFRLEDVSRTPAMFDLKKLDWMNNHYLQDLPSSLLAERGLPFLSEHGLIDNPASGAQLDVIARALPLVQVRIDRLSELPEMIGFLLRTPVVDAQGWAKVMSADWAHEVLSTMVNELEALGVWEATAIDPALRGVAAAAGVKPRLAFGPLRVAVSGLPVGPPLFESLEILGRDATLSRSSVALSLLEAHGANLPEGQWPLGIG